MKILLLSTSDYNGAGKATCKIFNAIKSIDIFCEHKVLLKSEEKSIFKKNFKKISNLFKTKTNSLICKFHNKKANETRSLSLFPSNLSEQINKSNFDIVHLTWINEFLNIEDIGKINKPIVWSLCDMWPIAGITHYDDYSNEVFWRKKNFEKFNFSKFDLDRWIVNRKIKSWKNNKINFIAPSQWLYDCAKESVITSNFPIKKVPWPIDRKIFRKINKNEMRKEFNLPQEKKIIIFNSFSGLYNRRKGWDLFLKAIKNVNLDFEIIVIGNDKNEDIQRTIKNKINWMGKFNDDKKMAKILNCGNLFLLPSRTDNLPQTGLEAQCCGLPVVTFDANGLKDLVDHKVDGFLADPFDTNSLSEGIEWILKNPDVEKELSENSLIKASKKWDANIVSLEYKKIYSSLI